jgi:hypothetical protein
MVKISCFFPILKTLGGKIKPYFKVGKVDKITQPTKVVREILKLAAVENWGDKNFRGYTMLMTKLDGKHFQLQCFLPPETRLRSMPLKGKKKQIIDEGVNIRKTARDEYEEENEIPVEYEIRNYAFNNGRKRAVKYVVYEEDEDSEGYFEDEETPSVEDGEENNQPDEDFIAPFENLIPEFQKVELDPENVEIDLADEVEIEIEFTPEIIKKQVEIKQEPLENQNIPSLETEPLKLESKQESNNECSKQPQFSIDNDLESLKHTFSQIPEEFKMNLPFSELKDQQPSSNIFQYFEPIPNFHHQGIVKPTLPSYSTLQQQVELPNIKSQLVFGKPPQFNIPPLINSNTYKPRTVLPDLNSIKIDYSTTEYSYNGHSPPVNNKSATTIIQSYSSDNE